MKIMTEPASNSQMILRTSRINCLETRQATLVNLFLLISIEFTQHSRHSYCVPSTVVTKTNGMRFAS